MKQTEQEWKQRKTEELRRRGVLETVIPRIVERDWTNLSRTPAQPPTLAAVTPVRVHSVVPFPQFSSITAAEFERVAAENGVLTRDGWIPPTNHDFKLEAQASFDATGKVTCFDSNNTEIPLENTSVFFQKLVSVLKRDEPEPEEPHPEEEREEREENNEEPAEKRQK